MPQKIFLLTLSLLLSSFWVQKGTADATLKAPDGRQQRRDQLTSGRSKSKACTVKSVSGVRNAEFKKAFDAKKYSEAADVLQNYLERNQCYDSLVSQNEAEVKGQEPLNAYLWALSDITVARFNAQQFAKCIEIAERTLSEYYGNALEMSKNEKIKAAFKANLERCEKSRFANLTKSIDKPANCPYEMKAAIVSLSGLGEDTQKVRRMKIGQVRRSALLDNKKSCLALVEVPVDAELLDGPEDSSKINIPFLVMTDDGKDIRILEAMNSGHPKENFLCGDFEMTSYKNGPQSVYRIKGSYGYCHGGTGSGSYDALWATTPTISKVDEISYSLH